MRRLDRTDFRPADWNALEQREADMSNGLKVFSGRGSTELTRRICASTGIDPGMAKITGFPDGETSINVNTDVRGRDCFVVQSTCPPVNENLMELLIFIDCLRRASARRVTAVIPYYGYARQDRKAEGRTPITAKLVANLIAEAGADRVLTMDLHAEQIQGFFDIPVDHLTASPVFIKHFKDLGLENVAVASPDVGNVKQANIYADNIGGELVVVDKRRVSGDQIVAGTIIGDVKGRTVLIFDDMITTAGTVTEAIRLLREHGASRTYVAATHAVFAGAALERLSRAEITQLCVTDTIALSAEARERLPNLLVLSVAELLGEAIRRIHCHESVSALFDMYNGRQAAAMRGGT